MSARDEIIAAWLSEHVDDGPSDYPQFICHECGVLYGSRVPIVATYYPFTCDVCKATNVPCTEPRDYGHLKDFPIYK